MNEEDKNPPKDKLNNLVKLYSQGEFMFVVKEAKSLLDKFNDSFFLWNVLGAAYLGLNKFSEAAPCFKKTTQIKPEFAEGYCNLGLALHKQNKINEAIKSYEHSLKINPNLAETHNNLGHIFRVQKKYNEAIRSYEKALEINPNITESLLFKFQQQAHICDWSYCDEYMTKIKRIVQSGQAIEPFSLISKEDNPEHQKILAENCTRLKYKRNDVSSVSKPQTKPSKLRIGYFSSDLHNHPVMQLIAGVLENHDRDKFEIYAFYFGPQNLDEKKQGAQNIVDEFIDINDLGDSEVVKLARNKKIDIAIDVNGYSGQSRTSLFAYGLAPVQINYLGYPSTMGAAFIDYIVADEVLIPANYKKYYSENIIYMPHCYQPNDNTKIISDKLMKRADFGLPNDAFVFCCFNNNFKISPQEFDIWMRLLSTVNGSVLWLLRSNEGSEKNLRKEAKLRGIDEGRIIFAQRAPLSEHLARHRLADLFLDTFNYNAHTTASDALWAGLPVITKTGKQFAARVGSSILNALDLSELITETEDGYEKLAYELATDKNKLSQIKQKLAKNIISKPLFDTILYTRHLENAYEQAYQKYFDGEPASEIRVETNNQIL